MESKDHILSRFDESLGRIKANLGRMTDLTTESLQHVQISLFEGNIEHCNTVIADEEEVDRLEGVISQNAVEVLTRFQPVASDLRTVISALRMCNDLERVSDQAVNIARKVRKLDRATVEPFREKLSIMFEEAIGLFSDSITAYLKQDFELARGIKARDKRIDELNTQLTDDITEQIAHKPSGVRDLLSIILIARHLERVGDHAKNIAENVIYLIADTDLRHQPS